MTTVGNMEHKALAALEIQLSAELKSMLPEVLTRVSQMRGETISELSLHGIIGGKNREYADVIRLQFSNPDDFFAVWLGGLYQTDEADQRLRSSRPRSYPEKAARRLIDLLQDPLILSYTRTFLTRNFYRQLEARTRSKPHERLWSLWFGNNQMIWGLLIAPALRRGVWTNDVSEIRRAAYEYWTIGHVLKEGLVDPRQPKPYTFRDLSDLLQFYRSILQRLSNSAYEQAIAEMYVRYVQKSNQPQDEPFLIPELRYAGLEKEHIYRLDYSILNSHTMEFVGFELSPQSTHMAVTGLKQRTQIDVNRELNTKWEKEMKKRNEYFGTFDIPIVTFTDTDLTNMENCFSRMQRALAARGESRPSLAEQLDRLQRYNTF